MLGSTENFFHMFLIAFLWNVAQGALLSVYVCVCAHPPEMNF